MSARPLDETLMAEFQDLADKARRARRLAADMTDPAVRQSLLDWACESEARMAELGKADTQNPSNGQRD